MLRLVKRTHTSRMKYGPKLAEKGGMDAFQVVKTAVAMTRRLVCQRLSNHPAVSVGQVEQLAVPPLKVVMRAVPWFILR
jgi:hypothetical protein